MHCWLFVFQKMETKKSDKYSDRHNSGKRNSGGDSAGSTSESCSTRPVTPTGLPLPCISSHSQTDPPKHSQPVVSASGQSADKRLRDVGVMCPTPSTNSSRQSPQIQRDDVSQMPGKGTIGAAGLIVCVSLHCMCSYYMYIVFDMLASVRQKCLTAFLKQRRLFLFHYFNTTLMWPKVVR